MSDESIVFIAAAIDHDYINTGKDSYGVPSRVGKLFGYVSKEQFLDLFADDSDVRLDDINLEDVKTRFRCKDDDGIVYYGGWLYNDPDCEVQFTVLQWCQNDAGCTTIEIKDDNRNWRQEIG